MKNIREELATYFLWYEFYEGSLTIEEAAERWKTFLEMIDDPKGQWANGQHSGDCTQEPQTCYRCIVEDAYKHADNILKILDK